jgi:hypothetical protein
MRASLNEIHETEQFLVNQLATSEALLFEAKMLTNPLHRLNVGIQKKIYQAVKAYHRQCLKKELQTIHAELFSDPTQTKLQQEVLQLFNS